MRDYRKSGGSGSSAGSAGSGPARGPDSTIHTFPAAMFLLGGVLILLGIISNGWQMFTTFTAFWAMMNPAGTPVNLQKQPIVFAICGLIATGAQVGLALLVWRIDTTWKKKAFLSSSNAETARSTAIELVQHIDLVSILCAISFVVDTIGDYTFVAIYTVGLGEMTGTFITFLYAAFLYALSTVVFVRGVEYIAAGLMAAKHLRSQAGH